MKKLALTVFFDVFALMLLGLIIVMSASSTYSAFKFESTFYLFNSHLLKVFMGLFLLLIFCFIPYEIYKYYSKWALLAMAAVLILTLIFAPSIKGAGRWLDLGIITVQPADIAKLVLIIHLAALIEQKQEFISDFKQGYLYAFIWVMFISGLIFIQPNISTGALLVIISLTILYVGGAKFKHIALSSLFSFFVVGGFAMLFSHSRSRIIGFIKAMSDGGDLNIQVKQALYGLGSGGLAGVGIGNSKQNNLFLPEAYGDFIFAILGEEMGFLGSVIVLLSYLVLFVAGILIAKRAKDRFGQLLAFGITFSIAIYAFVNVAVTTGLLPTTGLPLPFISYGGTSIIFLSISIGILVNIAIMNSKRENEIQVNTEKMIKSEDLKR
ncbi:MAG TPA: putative peptidoglycan glycosyltransferase FtsW [Ignavibacteriaceae bacterium]|nr:putative peptidoglycan glycosyltransferase FtsW [Ignavibacteriaceae bacterium]